MLVFSWKLSRSNELTVEANANISQIINSIDVLNNQYYNNMDRSEIDCFYFPDANPDTPVRFRGTCNESIPAVPNFDPVQVHNVLSRLLAVINCHSLF